MRFWKSPSWEETKEEKKIWKPYFAYLPTYLSDEGVWVWWEQIERKYQYQADMDGYWWQPVYRTRVER